MLNNVGGAESANIPRPPPSKVKQKEETTDNFAQCSVTSIYHAKIADMCRKVTATWCKNLANHSFTINVENPSDDQSPCICKIDIKAWQFWGRKGLKSLEVDSKRVEVYWDFRQAKFCDSPEPCSDYYVAIVSEGEVALVVGDMKTDAFKRTRKTPSTVSPTLMCKKEHVCGKKLFCCKAKLLDEGKQEHDIMIESSLCGPDDPEMWVSIDGTAVIRIMNLHWRFRGNEILTVNDKPVQIFWDVHDWLYNNSGSSHGLFIFTPGPAAESLVRCVSEGKNCINGDGIGIDDSSPRDDDDDDETQSSVGKFCYVLYAWKTE